MGAPGMAATDARRGCLDKADRRHLQEGSPGGDAGQCVQPHPACFTLFLSLALRVLGRIGLVARVSHSSAQPSPVLYKIGPAWHGTKVALSPVAQVAQAGNTAAF